MTMTTVRRIASDLLKVGDSRLLFRPSPKVAEALTRDDVRALIAQHIIEARPKRGVSRGRARIAHARRKARGAVGRGSKRGAAYAKVPRKRVWINKVRTQRALLKQMADAGRLQKGAYRKVYNMIKGGYFRSRAHILLYLKEKELMSK